MLRPQACRWFELVTARDALAPVLETLARAGSVELQAAPHSEAPPLLLDDTAPGLERFAALLRSHGRHWPPAAPADLAPASIADPAALLKESLDRLEAWRVAADPLLAAQERAQHARWQLDQLARVADVAARRRGALPTPALLSAAGRLCLALRLATGAPLPPASDFPAEVMVLSLAEVDGVPGLLVLLGPQSAMPAVDARLDAARLQRLPWPEGLDGDWAQARATLAQRQAAAALAQADGRAALQALHAAHRVPEALAAIARVAWLVHHGRTLAASERLAWVTGWTLAPDAAALCAPLQAAGLAAVARFDDAPDGVEPPSLLANPPWARAFEAFAQMLGQPGRDEADPSRLLALIAPLLFGFMFGDVGQGAVLLAAGLLLRRRWPALALLVPGGIAAMGFGLLFGSLFTREDLFAPLWLHPLQHPVDLLLAALALGALILGLGLLLNALQRAWRREGRQWWAEDAALVLAYAGALLAPWWPPALLAVAVAALWATFGAALTAPRGRIGAAARGLAGFVEHALQLAVNTVSFARVGAFALAHAGLSAAVTGIADAAGPVGQWIVLVLGNALILLLEGLVVGIQTTRLLLFEFFLRFLQGRGRVFRPLPPPQAQLSPTP